MPPALGFSALNVGYSFENRDAMALTRTPTPVMGRDTHTLSKAERVLGVQDTSGPPPTPTDWKPRGRKLHKMSSNLSLFTDIKNAIVSVGSRSASRAENRSPATPMTAPPPMKHRPVPLDLNYDKRSVASEDDEYGEAPRSGSTLPSYYHKHAPSSPDLEENPLPMYPPFQAVSSSAMERPGHLNQQEQDKILSNLVTNGMIPKKAIDGSRPQSSPRKRGLRKNSRGHVRGDSNASRESGTAYSSSYGKPSRKDSKGSNTQSQPTTVDTPLTDHKTSSRQSAAVLSPRGAAPDVHVNGVDSPETERVRTWITHSALSQKQDDEAHHGYRAEDRRDEQQYEQRYEQHYEQDAEQARDHTWLTASRPPFDAQNPSSNSIQTLQSAETANIFPIQGATAGDWASIKSRDRQSSILVEASARPTNWKPGKVYYTDLQFESVLALSDSDSESNADSEDSALYRKRLSMMSNDNDTQPTAWSSMPSTRSHSRKLSAGTHMTSSQRLSLSSMEQRAYPIPNAQALSMSRESSSQSQPMADPVRRTLSSQASPTIVWQDDGKSADAPMLMEEEEEDEDEEDESDTRRENEESHVKEAEETQREDEKAVAPSAPVPKINKPPFHDLGVLHTQQISPTAGPGPVWIDTLRVGAQVRKGSMSSMSTSCVSPTSHGPAGPAPQRPLPAPPAKVAPKSAVDEDDSSSVFSFPKPPRVPMSLTRTKSNDIVSTSGESAVASTHGSTDSADTVIPLDTVPTSHEPASSPTQSPVELPTPRSPPRSPPREYLSPLSAGPAAVTFEAFSPIRLGFPANIRKEMSDQSDAVPSRSATPTSVRSQESRIPISTPAKHQPPKRSVSKVQSLVQSFSEPKDTTPSPRVRRAVSPRSTQIPRLPMPVRGSPLMPSSPNFLTTGGDSVPPKPSSAVRVGQAVEKEIEALPAIKEIPVPPIPSKPARRFHLPTNSNASTITTVSAPGGTSKSESEFGSPGPLGIGIARSGSDGSALASRKKNNTAEDQVRQIRLSKIGKAV